MVSSESVVILSTSHFIPEATDLEFFAAAAIEATGASASDANANMTIALHLFIARSPVCANVATASVHQRGGSILTAHCSVSMRLSANYRNTSMRNHLSLAALLLSVTGLCQAQPAPAAPTAPAAGNPAANSGIKLDQSPLFAVADTNKDGKLSKAEWAAIKGSDSIFSFVDKNMDGFLTLAELNDTSPPDAADANKDGKLTVEEFQAVVGGGGGAPGAGGGAPPAGGGAPPAGGGAPPAGAPAR
jgi:hypothetical protein